MVLPKDSRFPSDTPDVTTNSERLAKWLPSFTDIAFAMPLVFVFAGMQGARSLLGDGDTGWHIRTGDWILAHRAIPRTDLFSYTRPGEPWFAWEWGWDVLFAALHRSGGMAAVVALSLVVIAATSALVYRLARRRSGSAVLALPLALAATAAMSFHWLARPHLFTLLFAAIFLLVLERAASGRTRLLWLLAPLTAVWTNLHGGFFVGVVLVAAYGLRRRPWPWLAAGAACALASLANPYGWLLHLHIFRYLTDPYLYNHIAEFRSINFQHPMARVFELLLALGAAAALWSAWRRRWTDALLIAMWGHLALGSARNIAVYAVIATPAIAQCLAEWLDALRPVWRASSAGFDALDGIARVPLWGPAAMLAVAAATFAPDPPERFRAEYCTRRYPVAAAAHVTGRVFTDDEWGDYLIYRLYPAQRVFVDGRSDFYGAAFGRKYLDVLRVQPGWEEHLRGYGVESILLSPARPLAGTLKESARWQAVYDDGVAILFRARGPEATQKTTGGREIATTARRRGQS